MENKAFVVSLTSKLGISAEKTGQLINAFSELLVRECADENRIAIPGFGSFEGVKKAEEIRPDLSSGNRMLFPPCIEMEFAPSAMLRKRLNS